MSEPTLTEVIAATMTEVMDTLREMKGMINQVQLATTTMSDDFKEFKNHVFENMDRLGTRVKALEAELEVSEVRPMNGA